MVRIRRFWQKNAVVLAVGVLAILVGVVWGCYRDLLHVTFAAALATTALALATAIGARATADVARETKRHRELIEEQVQQLRKQWEQGTTITPGSKSGGDAN